MTDLDINHCSKINSLTTCKFHIYYFQVTFLGVASPLSTVIIDSFRYIPPQYEDDCLVYEEDFVTTAPLTTPEPEPEECITYDFETNFDELFGNHRGLCTGFTKWKLDNYTTLDIDTPSSESHQFISPQSQISCVSSFTFEAIENGVVEVNVYMESGSQSDQIAVLVNEIANEKNDVVTGSAVLTPLHEDYVDGWHILRIVLSGDATYNAYVSYYFFRRLIR